MALWRIRTGGPIVANRGMVAEGTAIERGALILQESPLVRLWTGKGHVQWALPTNTFWADERAGTSNRLQASVAALTQAQRGDFEYLFRPAGPGTPLTELVDRFEHNAFHYKNAQNMYLVVYRDISSINHSCFPNAKLDICEGTTTQSQGQARLIATKTINAGDEIFMNYIDDHWLSNHTKRNNTLQAHWHFTCTCLGCSTVVPAAAAPRLSPAQIDTTERAIAQMCYSTLLAPALTLSGQNLATHINRLYSFISVLCTWGKWDEVLSQACLILGQLQLRVPNYSKTLRAAQGGLFVEQYLYTTKYTDQLTLILGQCYVKDPLLRSAYNGASLGPFPLT